MTDAFLRRVAKLLRVAHGADAAEGALARAELARLRHPDRPRCALRVEALSGEHADAAAMVVREGTGCEVLQAAGLSWAVGTAQEVSAARAACALLCEEWSAAWERSQAPPTPVAGGPAGPGGFLLDERVVGGMSVRLHFSGSDPALLAQFAAAFAPPRPADRRAFVLGLAQGAFARVAGLRARSGLQQRPASLLVRDEVEADAARERRREAEARWEESRVAAPGQSARPRQPDSAAAREAAARARAAAAQAERAAAESMRAGREVAASLRVGGIALRWREFPTALPPHLDSIP